MERFFSLFLNVWLGLVGTQSQKAKIVYSISFEERNFKVPSKVLNIVPVIVPFCNLYGTYR